MLNIDQLAMKAWPKNESMREKYKAAILFLVGKGLWVLQGGNVQWRGPEVLK
jgi:hypothetical protein